MNKKRAMERRLSESENSEVEEKEREQKTTKKPKKQKQHQQQQQPQKKDSLIQVVSKDSTEGKENKKQVNAKPTKTEKVPEDAGRRLKKDDKIFEFKSDLIFDLDVWSNSHCFILWGMLTLIKPQKLLLLFTCKKK